MGDFGHFLRLLDHRIHSKVDIELIFIIEKVKLRLFLHIKLVSFKNIDIFSNLWAKIYHIWRIPKYGHSI